jgi:hypothetical protein
MLGREVVEAVEGRMSRPKAHYSLIARNHVSGNRLKVELIDLPFGDGRRFRLRVNGPMGKQDAGREQVTGVAASAGLAGATLNFGINRQGISLRSLCHPLCHPAISK